MFPARPSRSRSSRNGHTATLIRFDFGQELIEVQTFPLQHLSLPTVNFIEDKGRALAEHMPQKMPIKRELKAEPSQNDEKDDAGPSAKKMRR